MATGSGCWFCQHGATAAALSGAAVFRRQLFAWACRAGSRAAGEAPRGNAVLADAKQIVRVPYRADLEPAATSGKCMAGVPGVFWRCPAVLQGPSTHNPAWVLWKTHTSKNWLIFPVCMWKWAESAPCGQARLWQPNGPEGAKSLAAWQSLSSRAEKLRIFS